MNVNVSFRDVNANKFREFKAVMVRAGMKAGEALNTAIDLYIAKFSTPHKKKYNLTSFKPENWGSGTEKDSSRVDEFVYGWKH